MLHTGLSIIKGKVIQDQTSCYTQGSQLSQGKSSRIILHATQRALNYHRESHPGPYSILHRGLSQQRGLSIIMGPTYIALNYHGGPHTGSSSIQHTGPSSFMGELIQDHPSCHKQGSQVSWVTCTLFSTWADITGKVNYERPLKAWKFILCTKYDEQLKIYFNVLV